jgi:dUTP pyrophosphatase
MKVSRIRNVLLPNKSTSAAAGLDIYIPEVDESFIEEFNKFNKYHQDAYLSYPPDSSRDAEIAIPAGGKVFIPTGLKFNIPSGFALIAFNKGGVSWKQNITFLASVIDFDYKGEVFATIHNYSNSETTYLQQNQEFLQLVLLELPVYDLEEVPETELFIGKESERGDGKLGSTGLN